MAAKRFDGPFLLYDPPECYLGFFLFDATDFSFMYCVKNAQIPSFFWSVFSRIRTEYGEIFRISPYSVQMQENIDRKKLRIWTHFTQ